MARPVPALQRRSSRVHQWLWVEVCGCSNLGAREAHDTGAYVRLCGLIAMGSRMSWQRGWGEWEERRWATV